MTVWILTRSERYEGSEILGVYATQEKAEEAKSKYLENAVLASCDRVDVDDWDVE